MAAHRRTGFQFQTSRRYIPSVIQFQYAHHFLDLRNEAGTQAENPDTQTEKEENRLGVAGHLTADTGWYSSSQPGIGYRFDQSQDGGMKGVIQLGHLGGPRNPQNHQLILGEAAIRDF